MKQKIARAIAGGAIATAMVVTTGPTAFAAGTPTCAGRDLHGNGNVLANHGHHVVREYVAGDNPLLTWPPKGQIDSSGGAALPGGPGAGGHLPNGVAPGASFCVPQAESPGFHFS